MFIIIPYGVVAGGLAFLGFLSLFVPPSLTGIEREIEEALCQSDAALLVLLGNVLNRAVAFDEWLFSCYMNLLLFILKLLPAVIVLGVIMMIFS